MHGRATCSGAVHIQSVDADHSWKLRFRSRCSHEHFHHGQLGRHSLADAGDREHECSNGSGDQNQREGFQFHFPLWTVVAAAGNCDRFGLGRYSSRCEAGTTSAGLDDHAGSAGVVFIPISVLAFLWRCKQRGRERHDRHTRHLHCHYHWHIRGAQSQHAGDACRRLRRCRMPSAALRILGGAILSG